MRALIKMNYSIFDMKKQVIIVILIFLVIAIIGMGVYYFYVKKSKIDLDNNAVNQQEQADNKAGDNQQVNKLSCEGIKNAEEKADCQAEAVKLLNSDNNSVCDSLITEADKSTCRQSYIVKEAAETGDTTKCGQAAGAAMIADCQAQVSFSLAIQKKDKKYCENIINKTDKENCLKVLSGMGVK